MLDLLFDIFLAQYFESDDKSASYLERVKDSTRKLIKLLGVLIVLAFVFIVIDVAFLKW